MQGLREEGVWEKSCIRGIQMRKNLKEARQKAGMTQKQVAEYLGVIERHYKAIEYGERLGSIDIWDKLEDLFCVNQRILRVNVENRPCKEENQ